MAFLSPLLLTAGTAAAGTAGTAATVGSTLFGTTAATLSTLGTAASVLGAFGSASAMKSSAKSQQQQLDYAAGQAEASKQREAEVRRREAALMISRGIAVSAASGGGTSGAEGLLMGIAEEGETAAQHSLYEGTETAKSYRYRGEMGVAEAKFKANATILGALGSAGTSLAGRFAPSAPPGLSTAAALDYGYSDDATGRIW